jgi:methylated-DNA-[protein]-cysteine S-methyltransferase
MWIRHTTLTTTLGELTLVAAEGALTGLYFPHHWYAPDSVTFGRRVDADADPVLGTAGVELEQYLGGARREFSVPLLPAGDAFQRRVWRRVAAIPYGMTRTYGEIAAELGDVTVDDTPLAQRVGQAVGRNPLCIFIPCHRVVAAGGRISGYAGGRDRKGRLLELEQSDVAAQAVLFAVEATGR